MPLVGPAVYRVIAVTSREPKEFAEELQAALTTLSSEGFTITGQMHRMDGSVILTGHKVMRGGQLAATLPELYAMSRPMALPVEGEPSVSDVYMYAYEENDEHSIVDFDTQQEVIDRLRADLNKDNIRPTGVHHVRRVAFEGREALGKLLRAYPPPKETIDGH
jgi:hypothetical protein